jgi:hypothetical protein
MSLASGVACPPAVCESHVFSRFAANGPLSRAEGVVFLGLSAFAAAQACWNIPVGSKAFESLSFLFAGFLGFAAPARAAH